MFIEPSEHFTRTAKLYFVHLRKEMADANRRNVNAVCCRWTKEQMWQLRGALWCYLRSEEDRYERYFVQFNVT